MKISIIDLIRSILKINFNKIKKLFEFYGVQILLLIIILIQIDTKIQLVDKLDSLNNTFVSDGLEKEISDVGNGIEGQIDKSVDEIKDEINKHKEDLCTYLSPCHVIIQQ